ncbi:MAG: TonB-dependent receptor [Chitinophagales bacterium]|nr:TonB-dependent receptor [Chitinophagales bacterium]MDW8428444.1 TonB-dependent receptor [Chitinophagales bacterium]
MQPRTSLFFSIIVLIATTSVAVGQCVHYLNGSISDAITGLPLAGAQLRVQDKLAIADTQGRFRLGPFCGGVLALEATQLGYQPYTDTVYLDGEQSLEILLLPLQRQLKEVEITAARLPSKPVQPVSKLSVQDLEEAKGELLGETLRRIAGVTILYSGPTIAKPLIHGLTGNRILILNNGVRQEGQQWGNEHAPEIDPFIAAELAVIKGAEGVRYGSDAIGGVVLVQPRPLPDSIGWNGEINLLGMTNNREGVVSAFAEQRLKQHPLSWRLQGTFRRAAAARTPEYFLQNTAYRENNFSATAAWTTYRYGGELYFSRFSADLGIFSGAHLHNLTDLKNALAQNRPADTLNTGYRISRPYQQVHHYLLKAQTYLRTSNGSRWSLMMASQYNRRSEFDKHRPLNDSLALLNRPELLLELSTHSAELMWQRLWSSGWKATAGLSSGTQYNTYSGRYFIPYYRNYSGAVFFIQRYRRPHTEWEAGLRYDYRWLRVKKYEDGVLIKPQFSYQHLSAHAGMLLRLTRHIDLHVHAGSGWRPPAVNELYSEGLHHGVAALEYGNPALVPEKAFQATVSLDVHDHSIFAGELTAYHTRIYDFIYLRPEPPAQLTIQGAFPVFRYAQTDAVLSGMDAAVTAHVSQAWSVASRVAILYAYDVGNQDYLMLMPPHQGSVTVRWSPFVPSLYEPFVSTTLEHTLQQRRVPAGSDYTEPPPAYTLLSASAGLGIRLGRFPLSWQLSGTNLTNRVYRNYLNRFRYYADEVGRNITLRLTLTF